MKTLLVCEKLMGSVIGGEISTGRIHSVFANACNIETEKGLVTLLSRNKAMAPMSAVIDDGEGTVDFREFKVAEDVYINFSPKGIQFSNLNIFADFCDAQVWSPGIKACDIGNCPEQELMENLKTVRKGLEAYASRSVVTQLVAMLDKGLAEGFDTKGLCVHISGFCSTNHSYEFLRHRFQRFIEAMAAGDIQKAGGAAEGVIGFGPGLTPAIDDFICGMMLAFIYMGYYYRLDVSRIIELNRRIAGKGPGRTTRISCEMLKYSAEGEANEAAKELLLSIFGGRDSRNPDNSQEGTGKAVRGSREAESFGHTVAGSNSVRIGSALEKAAGLGATSGIDMALGVYIGCRIIANSRCRGGFSDENMRGRKEEQLL